MIRRNGYRSLIVLSIVLLPLIVIGGCALTHDKTFSEGARDGTLQKFSKKGFIWKTYEGELALSGFKVDAAGNTAGNVFEFTVTDPSIVTQLEKLSGQTPVKLHYTQYYWRWPSEGSTSFVITKVEVTK